MRLEPYDRYILENHNAVRCRERAKWTKWMQGTQRMLRHTELVVQDQLVHVSTTFLGVDVNFDAADPVCFETMVLGGEHDRELYRYRSLADAEQGHELVVLCCELGHSLIDAAALTMCRELALSTLAKAQKKSVSFVLERRSRVAKPAKPNDHQLS